jgi:tetratricopeptide (TPR) repeat protein
MKKVVLVTVLAFASTALAVAPHAMAQDQSSQPGQITIKDPNEYNDYNNAIGQSDNTAKAAAIESFLQKYPQSVVKPQLLELLMALYQGTGNVQKAADAASRVLQVSPNDMRALFLSVYVKKSQALQALSKSDTATAQPLLDDAAALAQRGLTAPKPDNVQQADFDKIKTATAPTFHSTIALDALVKKDYKTAISEFRAELQATPPDDTKKGPALYDTYQLGNAYVQQDPKDLVNGFWFLARAANFLPDPQVDTAAQYWYKKYHGSADGYADVKSKAASSVFPPADFAVTPAPPPPSPQDLAHQAVTSTPDLKTLALADKEFILTNGTQEDSDKVWAVMKGVTAEVPGTVIEATADQVKVAVTDDAKASKTADFTINMKTSLKEIPAVGSDIKVDATFDSYTKNPAMIIMTDGEIPGAKKAPVHRPAATHKKTQ